ncbi:hypothetical protein AAFF_G00378010 [Aldrovandia affinis]|uniref:Uncharacterized protein n=1 Tax=Aldrovandia affinis TaxID=143900 RepID=A0AAD7SG45_9TELE|nr:hypothetical protein AAFF_G00378010 [Aldrovandia affinis]
MLVVACISLLLNLVEIYHLGFTKCRQGLRYRRSDLASESGSKAPSEAVVPFAPSYNYFPRHHPAPGPFQTGSRYSPPLTEPDSAYQPYNSKVAYKQNRDNLAVERNSKPEECELKVKKGSGSAPGSPADNQRRPSRSSKHSNNKTRLDDLKI